MHRPRPRHVLLATALAAAVSAPVGIAVLDRTTPEPLLTDLAATAPATTSGAGAPPSAVSRAIVRDPVGATPLPGATGLPPTDTPSSDATSSGAPDDEPSTAGERPTTTSAPATTDPEGTPTPRPRATRTTAPTTAPAPTTEPPTPASPLPEPSREPGPTTTTRTAPVPTPDPTPEPTAAPPRAAPGPSTTGVPAGTRLTRHDGDLTISKKGTVVDGLDVRGLVKITADDVTIRNSVVRGRPVTQQSYLVQIAENATGTKIIDTEIYAADPSYLIKGVVGANLTMLRTNVHSVIDQLSTTGGNVRVEASWFHDNLHYTSDPLHGGGPSHDDNVQISHGSGFQIIGNRFEGSRSASVMIVQNASRVSDVRIQGNVIDGGACSINLAEGGHGVIAGVSVVDNTFGTGTGHPHCAVISPRSTVVAHSGNAFTDGFRFGITDGR